MFLRLSCFNSDLASLLSAGWSSPMDSMFLSSTTDETGAVADLGGADGGNCPPFTMKIQLWRPLLGKKSAPCLDPNALFFQ